MRGYIVLFFMLLWCGGLVHSKEDLAEYEIPVHSATIAQERTTPGPVARNASIERDIAAEKFDILFVGDSITELWNRSNHGFPAWSQYYRSRSVGNLGVAGDWTQHTLWRLQNGNLEGQKPALSVIMVGGNNNPALYSNLQIAEGVLAVAKEIRLIAPDSEILILGVFPRGFFAGTERRLQIAGINEILATFTRFRGVHYLDISDIFLQENGNLLTGVTTDTVHLTPLGHQLWAEEMEPVLVELIHRDTPISITRDAIKLPAFEGFSYILQSCEDCTDWEDSSVMLPVETGEISFGYEPGASAAFYRVLYDQR